jgi:hypothetical protein
MATEADCRPIFRALWICPAHGRPGLLNKKLGPTHIEIDTEDLDALYHQLCAAEITPKSAPSSKPWDPASDFLVLDLDGHIIKFVEEHSERREAS